MRSLARTRNQGLARRGERALQQVRVINPPPLGRRASLKTMLGLGSQVMHRVAQMDPHYLEDGRPTWERMQIAWASGQRADRRAALTGLQSKLAQWTAEDANVAGDRAVQGYRKKLHLVLDH